MDDFFDTKKPAPEQPREVKYFDGHYKEFGKLEEVVETPSFVEIRNDKGQWKSKSKKYPSWRSTMKKAEDHIGSKIITRTSINPGNWSADSYFNDLVFDGGMLDIPEDAGPEARETIIRERLTQRHSDFARNKDEQKQLETEEDYKQRIEEIQQELQRMTEEREQLTPQQRAELDDAIKAVANAWPDFRAKPKRSLSIIGAGYNKKLGHIDKVFALRYGINVTGKKRIDVNIVKRMNRNYVSCYLPEYDNIRVKAALKISSHRDAMGAWYIPSVNYLDDRCWDVEDRLAPNGGKDIDKPIEWFLETHQKIMSEVDAI